MWQLEGYNAKTEDLECEIPLPQLDSSGVRQILHIDDDQPIEPFLFEANDPATLNQLLSFSDESINVEPSLTYFLAFSSD
ncbi:hypothetical protein A5733_00620 [Mycobacterium sp. NS-7484]|uniref:DUF7683 domain-containing protein n=1 Tax=unclassified Mycobacterium TaxID=2642494 RepID=UPI0008000548|nr:MULTISPECIES: hypothetical protein [unclassified Mycobacterium]OBG80390.1 hypothetical protein A5699_11175 [Mycobacterium sp. E802]OMC00146.1 hypothetical protein A5733_00620 [Mycobacterium sp. NS-7484]